MASTHEPAHYELRIGLVLFGGVSLAVYMNGVTQELLKLIRASQERDPGNPYTGLLQAAGMDVIIDVIAGTSAGGLNGLALAKALASGSNAMEALTDLWKTEAQIDKLVVTDDPHAALSGEIMEVNLHKVFKSMSETANKRLADKVPVLDLFVTATDLHGRVVSTRDLFGHEVPQVRNQHLFHLKKRTLQGDAGAAPCTPEPGKRRTTRGYDQNDFLDRDPKRNQARDAVLAKVGRATSAFPGALPPQNLTRRECVEADLEALMPDDGRQEVWFSDGGILMNKPFAPVVKTIFERSAARPVERVLLWLDPDPVPVTGGSTADSVPEPHILDVIAAPLYMPRNEDVAAYLEQIQNQSDHRTRVMEGFKAVEEVLASGEATTSDSALRGYRQMRVMHALSRLSDLFRSAFRKLPGGTALADRLTERLHLRLGLNPAGRPVSPDVDRRDELCALWDLDYQRRRLHYLLLRQDQLLEEAGGDDADRTRRQVWMTATQPYLWNALEDWNNARWVIGNGLTQQDDPELQAAFEALTRAGRDEAQRADDLLEKLLAYLKWTHDRAGAEEARCWSGQPADDSAQLAERLRATSTGFEARDMLLFPLTEFGQMSEWDPIDMVQLSPGPSPRIRRSLQGRLASEILGHFGGFLEQRWRHNDILWGQLDATEKLCDLVVKVAGRHLKAGEGELARAAEACIAQRHREILAEHMEILDMAKLQARFQQYQTAQKGLLRIGVDGAAPPAWGAALKHLAPQDRELVEAALQQAAAADMTGTQPLPPADLRGAALIRQAPIEVLWGYLTHDHRIGDETAASVQPAVLVNGLLGGLDNLIKTLDRNTPGMSGAYKALRTALVSVLRPVLWGSRIFLPRPAWLGHLVRLATLLSVLLWVGHLTGLFTLASSGKAVAAVLLAPVVVWAPFSRWRWLAVGALTATPVALVIGWLLRDVLTWQVPAPSDLIMQAGQTPAFLTIVGILLLASGMMAWLGRLPRTPQAPGRIISLETAGSLRKAHAIIESWKQVDPNATLRASFQIGADFLFVLGYAPLLALLAGLGAPVLGEVWAPLATAGAIAAWLQLVAGLLDVVENVGLMQVLLGTSREAWPRVARACALAKLALVFGAGIPFALAGLYAVFFR